MKLHRTALGLALIGACVAARGELVEPFETTAPFVRVSEMDTIVEDGLKAAGLDAAPACSDAVFVRRAYLDVVGTIPTPEEVLRFLEDTRPGKRSRLIDELLERPEFADYWALKWGDVLRIKAEYPVKLWPNAVQAYHRWVRDALRDNMPYDTFVRTLLTSSGSNFRVPPVNFYRAAQDHDPATLAGVVALTFMGERTEHWPAERLEGMAAFFSRVAFKGTAEWKEEIVIPDPAPSDDLTAVFPDGRRVVVPADADPRAVFADWLTDPGNPWLARCMANRAWYWLVGRGIVHEPDDFRTDNPPSNPALLDYLAGQFASNGYDLRELYRLILNSAAYQRSSLPRSDSPRAEALFAHYPVRRLDAEVLVDAFHQLFGGQEQYTSRIPEPFTFVPGYERTINLSDGSISSPFLEMFGRPARDSGLVAERNNQMTDGQRLHLANSREVQEMIARSPKLRQVFNRANGRGDGTQVVRRLYLYLLSRYPTPDELNAVRDYAAKSGFSREEVAVDLVWALVNAKEFLYRH